MSLDVTCDCGGVGRDPLSHSNQVHPFDSGKALSAFSIIHINPSPGKPLNSPLTFPLDGLMTERAKEEASMASCRSPKSRPASDAVSLQLRRDERTCTSETSEQSPVETVQMMLKHRIPPRRSASLGDLLRKSVKSVILATRVSQVMS